MSGVKKGNEYVQPRRTADAAVECKILSAASAFCHQLNLVNRTMIENDSYTIVYTLTLQLRIQSLWAWLS